MNQFVVIVVASLQEFVDNSDEKTKKLFCKQKRFMELYPDYPSLEKTKLDNMKDKHGNQLWEIRLDIKRRIVLVKKETSKVIWLKICSHDEIKRNNIISVNDDY